MYIQIIIKNFYVYYLSFVIVLTTRAFSLIADLNKISASSLHNILISSVTILAARDLIFTNFIVVRKISFSVMADLKLIFSFERYTSLYIKFDFA